MHPRPRSPTGQALVEFAFVLPVMLALLLGVTAAGVYFLGAGAQQAATGTIAAWAGEHGETGDLGTFAGGISPCPAVAVWEEHTVTVTLTCPNMAGDLLPMFPSTVATTATSYIP